MSVDGLERFPSARDIEKVARNPECETLRTALAANVDLRKYAIELGLEDQRQSPIAIARGEQVERAVLGKDAARLVEKLQEDGKVGSSPVVEDLGRRRTPNRAGMERAARRTDECITALLSGGQTPDILVHPVLSIPLGTDTQFIEPDALVMYVGARFYEPLELKSYAYREGRTDPGDLQQARRQSAVYVHALRGRVNGLGGDPAIIEARATLVFMAPTSLFPRPIYSESVAGEMRDVENAIRLLDQARIEVKHRVQAGEELRALLPTLETTYIEKCITFCALAKRCRDDACASDRVEILGEQSARILAPTGTVDRAFELLQGATPNDPVEDALAERLLELEKQVGDFPQAI